MGQLWEPMSEIRLETPVVRIFGDLTGITGPEENEKGLEDARVALCGT